MELVIDEYVRKDMLDHMFEDESRECCGLLTLSKGYERAINIEESPVDFKMDAATSFRVSNDPDVIGYFHSHPHGLMCPSKADMITQMNIGKPSIIAARDNVLKHIEIFQFGKHLLDEPLEGVQFRLSVYDCYETVRRYFYKERSITLANFPRDPMFWLYGLDVNEDLFSKQFKNVGFQEFDPEQIAPEPGDCLLYQTDGVKVINHCAVYVGNNCMLHHVMGKKSGIHPITIFRGAGWLRKWVRYVGTEK